MTLERFKEQVAPLKKPGCFPTPYAVRRQAAALSHLIGSNKVAYLYGVSRRAINKWRKEG